MTTTRGDVEERIRQKLRSDDEYFRQLTEIRASAEPLQHRPYQPRHERVEIEAEPGVDSPVSIAASAINRGWNFAVPPPRPSWCRSGPGDIAAG
jgi:hypothetical protein